MKELTQLEIGKRYTIVRQGDMGFVFKSHVEIVGAKLEPYAQYPESVLLTFKLRGKRNLRGMRFCPRDSYIVWEDWLSVNTEMFVETTEQSGMIVRKSLASCDPEYFERAKRSVSEMPLIEYRPN
ncbi:MAG: hypothetical protein JST16_03490 [Bdellovibrionales bacterium]|nr:hypothetical protein [Bdellovibrionales bacterium]